MIHLMIHINWEDILKILGYSCALFIVLYIGWWVHDAIEEIKESLNIIKVKRYESLFNKLKDVKASISAARDDMKSSVKISSQDINRHTSSEISTLRQMIVNQFTNQTQSLLDDVKRNRQVLSQFIDTTQRLQSSIGQNIKDNRAAINALSSTVANSLSTAAVRMTAQIKSDLQRISDEEEKRNKYSTAAIDSLMRNIYDFNNTITMHLQTLEENECKNSEHLNDSLVSLSLSLKSHTDNITSNISRALSSHKELYNKTKSSFDTMNGSLGKYLGQLRQIDNLYNNLQKLYNKLLDEEKRIYEQETSLTSMVARHSQIFELTSEMNNTSKDILEFMKLYLVQSTLDNYKLQ